jgi:hypothetical protein
VFQGRFKSLIVEEDSYLGALQHYVHLNPVRAGMWVVDKLKAYRWSSYWYLWNPRKRPEFMDISGALEHVGGLKYTPSGRENYCVYLDWLSADEPAQKEMAFEKMCRGWALGTSSFKRDLLELEGLLLKDGSFESIQMEGRELREANELQWENLLERVLSALDKDDEAISSEKKSAWWKVWGACVLKSNTAATNVWIADKLNRGATQSVSMLTSRFKRQKQDKEAAYLRFIQNITK